MSKFDEYMKEAGWSEEYRLIAESAWNAAIAQVDKMVSDNFDEMEPWIEPDRDWETYSHLSPKNS